MKILDFGLARAAEALRLHQSDAGMVRGKMSYLAPELLEGARADARSDVFSLGVVLHELLSGQRLFVGDTDFDTLKLVKGMPIPRPSTRNPGVKPALDGVVMRALERDPDKRYKSAGEMGDELETLVLRKGYSTRALAQQGARAGRPGTARRRRCGPRRSSSRRPVRRQRDVDGHRRRIDAQLPAGAGRAPTAARPRRGARGRWQMATVALGLPVRRRASWARRCGPTAPSAVVVSGSRAGPDAASAAGRPRRPRRRPPRPCAWRWIRRPRARR